MFLYSKELEALEKKDRVSFEELGRVFGKYKDSLPKPKPTVISHE
ncbi:unnamed protein product [marine sediment metagenome]|uniref:Uncharacterized protein n=1 Tax=marine sediment metagenome TaxID=412755 RepID=X1BC52_9ZZZZ